jgi:hypothetical protein
LGLLHQGVFIMPIKKPVRDRHGRRTGDSLTMPVFSYAPNDGLANLIVNAWTNQSFRDALLERESDDKTPTASAVQLATAAVNGAGFNLQRAVVISEVEHDNDYEMIEDNEVVFVLPDENRAFNGGLLLETAKLLMACTPNGI